MCVHAKGRGPQWLLQAVTQRCEHFSSAETADRAVSEPKACWGAEALEPQATALWVTGGHLSLESLSLALSSEFHRELSALPCQEKELQAFTS